MIKNRYLTKPLKYIVPVLLVMLIWGGCRINAEAAPVSGQCGDDVYWEYDDLTKTLIISGNGEMWDYGDGNGRRARYFYFDGIKNIHVEKGVTGIGEYAFSNCYKLEQVALPAEGLLSIGEYAFNNCYRLAEIVIPDEVKVIEEATFKGCGSLEKAVLSANLITIEKEAFKDCVGLKYITLNNEVEVISNGAFSGCESLKTIHLPGSVKVIEEDAFADCKSLEKITIPKKVECIYSRTFAGCYSLKEITLPKNLNKIEAEAFSDCYSLEKITVPDGVKQIDADAFENCIVLEKITLLNPMCEIGSMGLDEDVIICGFKDSTAQTYAKAQGMEFVLIYEWNWMFVGAIAIAIVIAIVIAIILGRVCWVKFKSDRKDRPVMRYPEFLKPNGTIGFVAPAFGCNIEPYKSAFENAQKKFTQMGYKLVEGPNCRVGDGIGISNTPEKCGQELNEFFTKKDVDCLFSCGGGELMCEVVPYIDFKAIRTRPAKWYIGYSDNTNMTFLMTTLCDTAAIYGPCAPAFGMEPWHSAIADAFAVITGEKLTLTGYDKWEKESLKSEDNPLVSYNVTEPVIRKCYMGDKLLDESEKVHIEGRLLGGCMDCLANLTGTKFDRVAEFAERYGDDGIIWFLEACELNVFSIRRALWQFEQAGWFKNVKGFLIGRPLNYGQEMMGLDTYTAVTGILGKYNVPILMDVDLGHLPPMMPLITGSVAEITANAKEMNVEMKLI